MARCKRDKPRSGIVVYFDLLPSLERMTAEQQGELFIAMLRYAKYGEVPEFTTERQQIIWEMTQPRLDADALRWDEKILQTKYAGYSSAERRQGREPMDMDSWCDWREHRDAILYGCDTTSVDTN